MTKEQLISKEEKIQKSFDAFFSDLKEETRKPYDFKRYNRSIYNILCISYKNTDDKIDWDQILKKFVPEDQKTMFRHTNVYNKEGIIKVFKEFFASQKKQGKTTRSISELNEWNDSLVITLSRKYGYQGKQVIEWEKFIKEYGLDTLGCTFTRNAPIRTPIVIEDINRHIKEIIQGNPGKKRSPRDIYEQKPQYLRRLGKKHRDAEGRIDRLYIIHKMFDDETIVKAFRHRYAYNRLLKVPEKVKKDNKLVDINDIGIDSHEPDPEQIFIEKEQTSDKEKLINKIYESIDRALSEKEKQQLFLFLEGNKGEKNAIDTIIQKIKDNLNICP